MRSRIMKEIYTKFTGIAGPKRVMANIATNHCGIRLLVPVIDLSQVMEIVPITKRIVS